MEFILLTQYQGAILGPIAKLLGLLLNFIYNLGIHNIGVCIILFTFIVYLLMLPLTIQQQKTARIQQIISPEIKKIQKKYKDKKDQQSQLMMQQELRELNAKYGVSTFGGCLNMLITFPILFAFYRVIYNVPAYVTSLKSLYLTKGGIVSAIIGATAAQKKEFIEIAKNSPVRVVIDSIKDTTESKNLIVDALWKFNNNTWQTLADKIPSAQSQITEITTEIKKYTTFLCYNISESPLDMLKNSWNDKAILLCIAALLIPIISAVTQWLNIRLMPKTSTGAGEGVESTARTMNAIMPVFSLVLCFTVPVGLGLYWIAAAVFRSVQQFAINQYLDRVGIETIIEKNKAKAAKKEKKRNAKKGISETSSVKDIAQKSTKTLKYDDKETEPINSNKEVKPGSIREKANLVQKYNEKNRE